MNVSALGGPDDHETIAHEKVKRQAFQAAPPHRPPRALVCGGVPATSWGGHDRRKAHPKPLSRTAGMTPRKQGL